MQTHHANGVTATPASRDFFTVLSILSVIVMVTTEAGAAFVAAAWGLSGLFHLPVMVQDGLYGIVAIATLAVAVWITCRAFEDGGDEEFAGAAQ